MYTLPILSHHLPSEPESPPQQWCHVAAAAAAAVGKLEGAGPHGLAGAAQAASEEGLAALGSSQPEGWRQVGQCWGCRKEGWGWGKAAAGESRSGWGRGDKVKSLADMTPLDKGTAIM